ncbi:hypothetical protein PUN28_018019 [Cardiocondyla obscurior]|uniref:Ankyrin repeat protein n=1 Tax=Cardiocondyla obscurior TaxID=286306 RepID=A0AAW2EJC3_9HYME
MCFPRQVVHHIAETLTMSVEHRFLSENSSIKREEKIWILPGGDCNRLTHENKTPIHHAVRGNQKISDKTDINEQTKKKKRKKRKKKKETRGRVFRE